jgi:hypothetical protein
MFAIENVNKKEDLALLLSLIGFTPCHANRKLMATFSLSFLYSIDVKEVDNLPDFARTVDEWGWGLRQHHQ